MGKVNEGHGEEDGKEEGKEEGKEGRRGMSKSMYYDMITPMRDTVTIKLLPLLPKKNNIL